MRKITVLSMLCAAALAAGAARADEKAKGSDTDLRADRAVVSDGGHVTVHVTATAEGGKDGEKPQVRIRAVRVNPEGDEKAKPRPKVAIRRERKSGAGGWLGVRISPVPAAVASQLALENEGVMIQNLLKGSPADKAGLERYDVVVAAGKDQRLKSVESFIAGIKARKPGDKVHFTVFRKGKKKSVTVALGEGPPTGEVEYVYEEDADELWQDEFKLHKGMLRKGPEGWIFQGPGGAKIELPGELWRDLPKRPWPDVQIHVGTKGGGKTSFKISRTVDGRTVEVEGTKEGGILVRKSGKGKEAVTRKYKNADELRKKDPEAHELYKGVHVWKPGIEMPKRFFPPKPLIRHGKEATDAMREQLRQLSAELDSQMKQIADRARAEAGAARRKIARAVEPEPRRQFEVDEKGRITVQVREGDTAAKLTFKDEAEMKEKAPKLHKAYEKLLRDAG
jgi:ElaB/YqjD/DUF883 family membrane-anchored ribosome-binding protein